MKTVISKKALKILISQNIYNENEENPIDLSSYEEQPMGDSEELKTYTPDDLSDKFQDGLEDENPATAKDIQNFDNIAGFEEEENDNAIPKFGTFFQAYRWAKENKKTIRIKYKTLKGIILIRDIEPVGDFFARTTKRRNVAAWDKNVNDVRTYTTNGVLAFEFTGEEFVPKFNFSKTRKNYIRRLRRRKNKSLKR